MKILLHSEATFQIESTKKIDVCFIGAKRGGGVIPYNYFQQQFAFIIDNVISSLHFRGTQMKVE